MNKWAELTVEELFAEDADWELWSHVAFVAVAITFVIYIIV
ncbi:hypothetical protein V6R85_02405 [Agrobacterium sp. CCNWLW32]